MEKLPHGLFAVGNGIYGICAGCDSLVKINGFWGGKHLCSDNQETPEELGRSYEPVKGEFTSLGISEDGTMASGYIKLKE